MWRQMGRCLPNDLGIYHHILRGGNPKGGLADTDCVDSDLHLEVGGILPSEDVGHNCPTCDLSHAYVLCARVHVAHSI